MSWPNYHAHVEADGRVHVNMAAFRDNTFRGYAPGGIIPDLPRRLLEKSYPDPMAAIRTKLRAIDKKFLNGIPFVFRIHDSWLVSYPTGNWKNIGHRLAIFNTWGDAMMFANMIAAAD